MNTTPQGVHGAVRAVLIHPGKAPTTLAVRGSKGWTTTASHRTPSATAIVTGGTRFPLENALTVPEVAVGGTTLTTTPRGKQENLGDRVDRILTFGPRWQTLADTENSPSFLRLTRGDATVGSVPTDIVVDHDGMIRGQVVWKGTALVLLGFVEEMTDRRLSLTFDRFWQDPHLAKGLLPVVRDWSGATLIREGRIRQAAPSMVGGR